MLGMVLDLQEGMGQCFLGAGPGAGIQAQQALQQMYCLLILYRVRDDFLQYVQPCLYRAALRGRLHLHTMTMSPSQSQN